MSNRETDRPKQIFEKLLSIYTLTENGFFASFSPVAAHFSIVSLTDRIQKAPFFDMECPTIYSSHFFLCVIDEMFVVLIHEFERQGI